MPEQLQHDSWSGADAYDGFIGRWSRLVAREFLAWLDVPPRGDWLDVGCGTGALSEIILTSAEPASLRGIDPSGAFVDATRSRIDDKRASFDIGDAEQIHAPSAGFDAVVSGLVLNFVPDAAAAVREFARVVRSGGVVGVYVWDYDEGMRMLRLFWDAATALDPAAASLDEAARFPICDPARLRELFEQAGLVDVEHRAIDVPAEWPSFDAFWRPFLGGTGPAPSYVASLSDNGRNVLRERLSASISTDPDGAVHLSARAWAIKGRAP
jgi:ubiquinone/menaquinone biosynthesis C-methylase UbiE